MLKFNVVDDCNFSASYLLHPKFVLDENDWVGFQFNSSFCSKEFSSMQDVMKFWHAFSARRFSFGLYLQCKVWGIFHYCKAIFG